MKSVVRKWKTPTGEIFNCIAHYADDDMLVLHSEDSAAIEIMNGARIWKRYGILHRVDGPAWINCTLGVNSWYKNGLLHREDGPAVEWNDGSKYWWVNGKNYSEVEYNKLFTKLRTNQDE